MDGEIEIRIRFGHEYDDWCTVAKYYIIDPFLDPSNASLLIP